MTEKEYSALVACYSMLRKATYGKLQSESARLAWREHEQTLRGFPPSYRDFSGNAKHIQRIIAESLEKPIDEAAAALANSFEFRRRAPQREAVNHG